MSLSKDNKGQNEIIDPEVYEVSEDMKLQRRNATMENALIEARYNLTVEEQRLILATIAMLDSVETRDHLPVLKIPVKLIIETTGIHEKNYNQIKNALQRLMGRVITIEDENGFELYQWFIKAKYEKGQGSIEVQFHPDLKPFLLGLKKRFTKIPLNQVLQLRSKYAIRLYELLKRYEDTGFRTDYLPELRLKLGVEENEYKVFKDFERRVLKPAVNEINEKTDLEVNYTKKKTGRKITHIEFEIKSKKAKEGDTTETTNSVPESVDTQGQKQPINNQPDLWKGVIKILANKYDLTEEEYNTLLNDTRAIYKDKQVKLAILTDKAKEVIQQYKDAIKSIIKVETNDTYALKVLKRLSAEAIQLFIKKKATDQLTKQMLTETLKNTYVDEETKTIYIFTKDAIYMDWFEINFKDSLKKLIKNLTKDDYEIVVKTL